MLIALSALYEDLDTFDWYTYIASRGTSLVSPKARVILRAGDVFGIKPVRGGRHKVILADAYKQNFTLEDQEGSTLLKKSKLRKKPKIQEQETLRRTVNKESHKQAANFRAWDSDFFKAARKINKEAKDGVDFSNYQWRKLSNNAVLKIQKTQSKFHVVRMGTVFGVRYLVPAKGGIYIDLDGRRMSLSSELWEEMLSKSQVMQKTKWPTGKFTVDQMKSAMEQDVEIRKQQTREEKLLAKEQKVAEDRAKRDAAARAKAKALADKKREEDRLIILRAKDKIEQAKRKKETKPREIDQEAVDKYLKDQQTKEQADALEDLDLEYDDDDSLDDDLDLDEANDSERLSTILEVPEDADVADDAIDPLDNLDAVIKEKRAASPINIKDFGDDEDEEEDDDDSDVEFEDDEDDYDDEDDEEETDPDAAFEDAEADEDEAEAEVDEDETSIADDELEEPEEADDASYRADEGDVITFNSDSKDNREFVLLDVYPFAQNNSIMIYKVYDITTEPEGVHSVRINTLNKRKFEDMVTLVRKLDIKELQELLDITDDYPKLKESIVS